MRRTRADDLGDATQFLPDDLDPSEKKKRSSSSIPWKVIGLGLLLIVLFATLSLNGSAKKDETVEVRPGEARERAHAAILEKRRREKEEKEKQHKSAVDLPEKDGIRQVDGGENRARTEEARMVGVRQIDGGRNRPRDEPDKRPSRTIEKEEDAHARARPHNTRAPRTHEEEPGGGGERPHQSNSMRRHGSVEIDDQGNLLHPPKETRERPAAGSNYDLKVEGKRGDLETTKEGREEGATREAKRERVPDPERAAAAAAERPRERERVPEKAAAGESYELKVEGKRGDLETSTTRRLGEEKPTTTEDPVVAQKADEVKDPIVAQEEVKAKEDGTYELKVKGKRGDLERTKEGHEEARQ